MGTLTDVAPPHVMDDLPSLAVPHPLGYTNLPGDADRVTSAGDIYPRAEFYLRERATFEQTGNSCRKSVVKLLIIVVGEGTLVVHGTPPPPGYTTPPPCSATRCPPTPIKHA